MSQRHQRKRKGHVLVLSVLLMVTLMAFLAFSIDLGYLCVAREQLQRAADASALAATWELIDENGPANATLPDEYTEHAVRTVAAEFASHNDVLRSSPGLSEDNVQVGYIENPMDPTSPMLLDSLNVPNAVRVQVQRTSGQNGAVPLAFARILGIDETSCQADATAAVINNIKGFTLPPDCGRTIDLLPFALDLDTWQSIRNGDGEDNWAWDAELGQVVPGSDGCVEGNMYPQGTGSPGNRGTVDVGSSNNSTADISRQIVDGVNDDDMEHHGGSLEFDAYGELDLNGDTGISAGVKDELASIIGDRRIIPIFSEVQGNGNNAQYTIVQWAGIRIMEVKLTGKMSGKRVIIQPANVICDGVIPATDGSHSSDFLYSSVWLVR